MTTKLKSSDIINYINYFLSENRNKDRSKIVIQFCAKNSVLREDKEEVGNVLMVSIKGTKSVTEQEIIDIYKKINKIGIKGYDVGVNSLILHLDRDVIPPLEYF